MNELQSELLELFKLFVKVCEDNHLQYYASGGTALGAVRHHGFIPWDDDIDIDMPRKDFDRLMDEVILPDGIKAVRDNHLLFGSFRNTMVRVTHGEAEKEWDRKEPFLSIDVFPIDGTPDNPILRNFHVTYAFVIFGLIKLKRIAYIQKVEKLKNRKGRPKIEKLLIRYGSVLRPLVNKLNEDELVGKFYGLAEKYDFYESKVVGCYSGRYRYKEFIRRSIYGNGISEIFENMKINVPKRKEAFLTHIYGEDYGKLPSEGKRERHGNQAIITRLKG